MKKKKKASDKAKGKRLSKSEINRIKNATGTIVEIAERFGVSVATVSRWRKDVNVRAARPIAAAAAKSPKGITVQTIELPAEWVKAPRVNQAAAKALFRMAIAGKITDESRELMHTLVEVL